MKPTANPWKNCLEFTAISDIGLRRSNNQDSHDEVPARNQKIWNSRGHVFCVADGMGAHAAGELASKMATDTVPMVYLKQAHLTPSEALRTAIQEANQNIHRKGNSDKELHGMGTTCDTLVILPEGALIGHVGDSRVYRLRGKKWVQMTADHSMVWEKELKGEPIDDSVQKNVITRCLGVSPDVKVDIEGPSPLQPGDIFLLCSDGLCGQFENDSEMGQILSLLPLEEATQALVDLANLRGGPDNITVITVKYLGPQQAEPTSADPKPVPPAVKTEMPLPIVSPLIWRLLTGFGIALFFSLLLLGFVPAVGLPATLVSLAGVGFAGWKILLRKPVPAFTSMSGKGPYRGFDVLYGQNFAADLKNTFKELRESALQQEGRISLKKADALAVNAQKALAQGNYGEAIRNFMRAISDLWRQFCS